MTEPERRNTGDTLAYGSPFSSFTDHLRAYAPHLLPENRFRSDPTTELAQEAAMSDIAPHGTTIVAVTYDGGVILAGDRRATQGNLIASRDVEKVYVTDEYSAAGIAGTAGLAIELVRLFAVELEHYEKIEGVPLTFNGKANKLSSMVRANLGAAMQGLAVVPLLVGYDLDAADARRAGRIVSYDVVGGRYEERSGYHAVGSGSLFAKSAMKKLYRDGLTEDDALRVAVEALYDAADDDSATGGPDLVRGILPTAVTIGASGAAFVESTRTEALARAIVQDRTEGGQRR
ncbi:proteasome subunit beta [Rhodococcus kroppenstedtii]|uniref:Proteasome subunit beta n=1 Tax=Rhodococcoides kroppenstedtii TaxID=293050 RepID=A0A1I0UFF3_9NOCA|nr:MULTISPECIES: proteasome subunit beta [Rhodococcus]AMY19109.1 Proteasome subunit beta 1 [Rhodococcus sp. PBTS 1]MBT1190697.1 proteasome subunit beta [Rhodococcus kroppenstedtii]MBY6311736.1 proteasome subunit beta [Rhodococcus kroppenstedtii]MBY6319320.1 proteasome subunit beta [Rhodococcus kroppenstedtii]MBY6398003.1 proteasome subunit beta [Rhodococcus kroppenstedtii]